MKLPFLNTPSGLFLFLAVAVIQLLSACSSTESNQDRLVNIQTGTWRAALRAQGQEIPFIMEAEEKEGKTVLYLVNGEERILLDDIQQQDDSLRIGLHIFDADLIARVKGDKMEGRFVKHDAPTRYSVPFTAMHGLKNRFATNPAPAIYNFDGKWEVFFLIKRGAVTTPLEYSNRKRTT